MSAADVVRTGDVVRVQNVEYRVDSVRNGQVVLAGPHRAVREMSAAELAAANGFTVVDRRPVAPLRDLDVFDGLPEEQRDEAVFWERHVKDVMEGRAWDGEGPNYDPLSTSMRQREEAKVRELAEAGRVVSRSRLVRLRQRYQARGILGLADGRSVRESSAGSRVDPRVREVLARVLSDASLESTGTMDRLHHDLTVAVREELGADAVVPSVTTLRRMVLQMREGRHVLGSARTRRTLSQQPQREFGRVAPVMPGELVQIDSTPLDVAVVFDQDVVGRVELTAMVDVATRTIMAVAVRPSTKAADLGALLAHAVTPEPMRPGWPEALRLSASVLPYRELVDVDERLASASARPIIRPQTIVMDHGKQYTSRAFEHACRHFGINVQPAHPDTPTDKPHVERTLQSVSTLFVQYLPGYLGRSVERRGQKAEQQAVLSLPELQDVLEQWVVAAWQNRPHEGLRDPLNDGVVLSPNEMYAAMLDFAGYVPLPVSGDAFIEMLPSERRKIGAEGIRLGHRVYDSPELNEFRHTSDRRHARGLWEVRHDPYDLTRVFVRVPDGDGQSRFVTAMWRHLNGQPAPFGADVWRVAQQVVLERGERANDAAAIKEVAHDIVSGQRENAAPTKAGRAKARRARVKNEAALSDTRREKTQREPAHEAPPAKTGNDNSSPVAPVDEAPKKTDAAPSNVVPLRVYDAKKESESWW